MMNKKWLWVCGVVASVLVLVLLAGNYRVGAQVGPAPSPWDDPALLGKIHPALLKRLVTGQVGPLPIVVEMSARADLAQLIGTATADRVAARSQMVELLRSTAQASQRDMRAFLSAEESAGRATHVEPLWIVNAVGVHASPQTIWQLAARSDVALIREDRWHQWLSTQYPIPNTQSLISTLRPLTSDVEWGIHQIRADEVWAALGITGTGVVVANMDTGVDFLHPALSGNYRGCARGLCQHTTSWFDATPNGATYPVDGHGHGTHTMGTLAGQSGVGVAPGARWIAARILDSGGYGYDTWIHAGFQWILAPGGDPSMSPDLVSNSWGSDLSASTIFQDDLRALRTAGILAVFSNGNRGFGEGTVGSPASLPEAFAVGATDNTDMVALFSSRGPSPWGEIRPHIVAPGVQVRSAWPGGSYQWLNGTSMAAPHVAGTVALVLSAQPGLTISATMYVLTTTAVPLSTTLPNNESGWGRVDAYAAVRAVANAGTLSGTVRDAFTSAPISGAWVSVGGAHTMTTQTGADGHYLIGMASGVYAVSVSAFGYEPDLVYNVVISSGLPVARDFALTPLAAGTVRGALADATNDQPITASVAVLNTPVTQTAFGVYSLNLPVGTYTLRVSQLGYRVLTATVTLAVGETVTRDVALTRGPKVLLVDGGAWYSQSEISYFQQALDGSGYAYNTWSIKHAASDVPRANDLLAYDVVIWSSPQDSPGFVGAGGAISNFLTGTHSLMISGQDVAFWDGGGSGFTYAPYLESHLKTRYVADDSGSRALTGLNGEIMSGLAMTITGPGGANNQLYPDSIAVSDPWSASQILAYQGDGSGGQKVEGCVALKGGGGGLRYRGVVLSYGFEAINAAATRQAVIQRVMDLFASPPRPVGLALSPESQVQIGRPGETVSYTISVRNLSQVAWDVVTLTVSGGAWPVRLSTSQVTVPLCSVLTAVVTVTLPAPLDWNVSDAVTLTAQSSLSPSIAVSSVLTTKTPAPVLLVDDTRWYDQVEVYKQALTQAGVAFDTWHVNPQGLSTAPPALRLAWYPVVVWFTGYNWYDPVKPEGEANLDAYLSSGGRLFLTSPFYLWGAEHDALAFRRLGVMTFTDDLTTTIAYGAASSPIGSQLGTFTLTNPFPNAGFFTLSGGLVPSRDAATALRGSSGRAVAIHRAEANSRSVFMAIPFESLTGADAARVMSRIVGWLGWLGDSTLAADHAVALPGERVAFAVITRHNGPAPIHATMTATLPLSVTLDPNSLTPGASFDPMNGTVTWTGTINPGEAITASYQITLVTTLLPGAALTTTAVFHDDTHGIPFDQVSVVRVSAPDLALSELSGPGQVRSLEPLTQTLVVVNTGPGTATDARVALLPPLGTRVVTWTVASGIVTLTRNALTWQGSLASGESATLTYRVDAPRVLTGSLLLSEALLWDGAGGVWERKLWTEAGSYQVYLPIIFKR